MNSLHLEISNQYDSLACPIQTTEEILRSLERSGEFPIANGELSVVFVTDKTIAQIHERFMADPSTTDVITFPADATMNFAGEIIVSVDHALKQAKALNEPFSRELSLYIIHGWLHLAGYDDRSDRDRSVMREAEKKALIITKNIIENKGFKLKPMV